MKFGVMAAGMIGLLALSGEALAQTPRARTGFQMDIRTGYSVPLGKLEERVNMSDRVSGQVPFILDIGGKPIPELFIGGYFGLAFGGTAGLLQESCKLNNLDCASVGVHLGVEVQYHILPGGPVNPWLGYGIGIESLGLSSGTGSNGAIGYGGFQFARFMGGVDFRLTRVFGVGPFVDLSMASYKTQNIDDKSTDIAETAVHEWLTLGVRFVFFP